MAESKRVVPIRPDLEIQTEAEKPTIAPTVTATGGDISDIIILPPASRGRASMIADRAKRIGHLASNFTTRSTVVMSAAFLDTIIAEATALRAELPL